MTYWKFFRPGAVGVFSGHRWSAEPGAWTEATAVGGRHLPVHACELRDLPYWLAEELWQVELDGEVARIGDGVCAPKGRLVRRITSWDSAVADEFGLACFDRVVGYAVAQLDEDGMPHLADRLDAASAGGIGPAAVADLAETAAGTAAAGARRSAAVLCGYVRDAADCLDGFPVASVAYITARAATQRSAGCPDPYLAEREWQSQWLAGRLGLQS